MDTLLSVRDVARLFALKESRLRYWAQTGFINPSGRRDGRLLYTFSDLVELKAARELLNAGIPLQRVRRNLQALRSALPDEQQLLGRLRVRSDGEHLIVTQDNTSYHPDSGQLVLDFELDELGRQAAEVVDLARAAAARRPEPPAGRIASSSPAMQAAADGDGVAPQTSYGWFMRGCACDDDPARLPEALHAYEQAIALDPGLAAAHTNLGNLHYRRAERAAAIRCYETACAIDPDQAEARYNLANIYEEEGDLDLAIAEYRRALHSAPEFADAHFNLALALERVGGRMQAMRHWRRYLELAGDAGPEHEWYELARQHLSQLEHV